MTLNNCARTSVIIPTKNAESTLVETLDCLLAQTDPDWQALIINDESTDQTAQIIHRYVNQDSRFISLSGSGKGVSSARNIGLAHATGQRILFLDSDDWVDSRFLKVMNKALDDTPGAVAAYCGYCRVMPDGQKTPVNSDSRIEISPFEAFARSCFVAIHAVLIDRDVVIRAGCFDTSLKTCEDWDLWQKVSRLGGRWVHVDALFSFYRGREGSLSRDVEQFLEDGLLVIQRGFSADIRLSDIETAYPLGASTIDGNTFKLSSAYYVLWLGAFDCGSGGTGIHVFKYLADLPATNEYILLIVDILIEGASVGSLTVPSKLASNWSNISKSLTGIFNQFEKAWNDPNASRRLQYQFEQRLLEYDGLSNPRQLSLTLGLRVNLRKLEHTTPPAGVDCLYVHLCDGNEILSTFQLGVLGTVTPRDWVTLAIWCLGYDRVTKIVAPSLGNRLNAYKIAHCVREAFRSPKLLLQLRKLQQLRITASQKALFSALGPNLQPDSHRYRLEKIQLEAEQLTYNLASTSVDPTSQLPSEFTISPDDNRKAYWEDIFQKPDPWNYGSAYEQEKYARQLQLLPKGTIASALELACAEGLFTQQLAPRVQRLLATDISTTALERAVDRCRQHDNIEFKQLDLVADVLPQELDLIFCSEVLYYLKDEAELVYVAQRFADSLTPGGSLITAHAYVLTEDVSKTGYDWGHSWGAKTISRVFSNTPGLVLEYSICTELYRIDRFVRVNAAHPNHQPVIETLPIHAEIETEVARYIVWGGAIERRAEVAKTEQHHKIPVLMYHRVSDEGPAELSPYRISPANFAEQMTWLRRNGYHTIVSNQLDWFLQNKHPFVGRPVMITFDDGYQDFAEYAWPTLQRHDFTAEVFIVTDLVGQAAEWDRHFGEPASLMDSATLVKLAKEGVLFGSHLASHRRADGLSTYELAEELTRSKAILQRWLDCPIDSFAAPFGATDSRLRLLAAECGYRIGFGTESGVAQLTSEPLNLPRIEVRGDMSLESFIKQMEACR